MGSVRSAETTRANMNRRSCFSTLAASFFAVRSTLTPGTVAPVDAYTTLPEASSFTSRLFATVSPFAPVSGTTAVALPSASKLMGWLASV